MRLAGFQAWLLVGLAPLSTAVTVRGADFDESKLPSPAATQVDYERDIQPIFVGACFRCHGPERPKSGFRLDNQTSAHKGGENGVAIVPGQSARSPLVYYVARLVEDMGMPPPGKGEPLTAEQVALIRAWIDQGARYPATATNAPMVKVFSVSPAFRGVWVSGNARQFREHWWMPNGTSGGLEGFEWQEPLGPGARVAGEGRILSGGQEYRLKLGVEKDDLGFVRGGFQQDRKWYDDTGGYYPPFGAPARALGRDLDLDLGKAWIEVGLTAPRYPRVTLGYEHEFRDGAKSTLQWGSVLSPGTPIVPNLYPASKDLNEKVHLIRLDVSHTVAGVLLEDSFRGELYDLQTRRSNVGFALVGQPAPAALTQYSEGHKHFQGANAFRLEKSWREGVLVSGGYLYSTLDGSGFFGWSEFAPPDYVNPTSIAITSQQIVVGRETHVFNANTLLGPWGDLAFSGGVQSEWTRQDGFTAAITRGVGRSGGDEGVNFFSRHDKSSVEENVALRYTGIPFTVLFASGRFQQVRLGQHESGRVDDGLDTDEDFLRDTRAREDFRELSAGFVLSPWQRVAFHADVRRRARQTQYNHRTDWDAGPLPGEGYPAFIRERELRADEIRTKLVLHPWSWLKAALKYQDVSTDYLTVTDTVDDLSGGGVRAGGRARPGRYRARVPSVQATMLPWRRLCLATTFSYTASRLETGANDGVIVGPYEGDIYSMLTSATFTLNPKIDLRASHTFSQADYRGRGGVAALPLGLAYDRHALLAGVTRRFKKDLTAALQYGFFRYREPTSGGARDYTAHAIFASLTKRLP
jgi:mono/diheme cytochrome c family protein